LIENEDITTLDLTDVYGFIPENKNNIISIIFNF
jgi:hypothetical protein